MLGWPVFIATAAALVLAALSVRRLLLRRAPGALDMSVRRRPSSFGRGWTLGVGRYGDDLLLWYRAFSFATRPRLSFPRAGFRLEKVRRPAAQENMSLLTDSVIIECQSSGAPVQLAIRESALPGFRAWLDGAPPPSAGSRP